VDIVVVIMVVILLQYSIQQETKKNAELRELFRLEPVSLVIKNGKLKLFERKDDADLDVW